MISSDCIKSNDRRGRAFARLIAQRVRRSGNTRLLPRSKACLPCTRATVANTSFSALPAGMRGAHTSRESRPRRRPFTAATSPSPSRTEPWTQTTVRLKLCCSVCESYLSAGSILSWCKQERFTRSELPRLHVNRPRLHHGTAETRKACGLPT